MELAFKKFENTTKRFKESKFLFNLDPHDDSKIIENNSRMKKQMKKMIKHMKEVISKQDETIKDLQDLVTL